MNAYARPESIVETDLINPCSEVTPDLLFLNRRAHYAAPLRPGPIVITNI